MRLFTPNALRALCLALIVTFTGGFTAAPGCSPEEKRSVEQKIVTGLEVAARAVPPGIVTVRMFRVKGKIEAATSLKLARSAAEVNSAAARLTQAALDGADAKTLAAQLDVLLKLASDLQSDGTLHIKNEETRFAFDLSVILAKDGLEVALRELKREGVTFTLEPETITRLGELKTAFAENDRLLREAVARLSAP